LIPDASYCDQSKKGEVMAIRANAVIFAAVDKPFTSNDELIAHGPSPERINEGFGLMRSGESIGSVITF
jgi:Zn-dependent alcohol dehydrogenase